MTDSQKRGLESFLLDRDELHHGDCIGADSDAHDIAESLGLNIVIHPPSDPKKRAFRTGKVLPEKYYLIRNKDIVNQSDHLIATPGGYSEEPRGGTWFTIRFARQQGVDLTIIYPDGSID